jgi:hypothetical protein
MANNIQITEGSGRTIATDEIAGINYPRTKLTDGAEDSTTPINAGSGVKANGLRVAFSTDDSLPAGTAKIGAVDTDADSTPGSAVPATALYVAGTDGANARGILTDTSGRPRVAGAADHDAVVAGAPVLVGAEARASTFGTPVASGDAVRAIADTLGRLLVSHIDPAAQVWKSGAFTGAQTGFDLWTPAGGKKIALTNVIIGIGGTTGGDVTLWIGASGDSSYTAGTDQLVGLWHVIPSATVKQAESPPPLTFAIPLFAATVDHRLKLTTSAGITIDIATYGYEF